MDKAAFFDAIAQGNELRVHELLHQFPGLIACRHQGVSPVLWACYHRHENLALVLAHKVDPDIWEASALGDRSRIDALLAEQPALKNLQGADGFSPLHLALFFGHAQAAQHLVERGCDLNQAAGNPSAVRPIHSAAACRDPEGRLAGIALLIGAGCDVNAAQQGGFRALHAVAAKGDKLSCEHLLLAGAKDLAADDGKRASDLAETAGFGELAALIRAKG
ncbi:ankyrin repeat domain-containing protein [Gallaecimonas kandeliae]|uniref:ankyrin repeat domain-containing protein n=1 Tax=Gallaecimonas kandeliae TaxID=3029055 RepID=UPI00264980F5|nr:ankyrin repeat domain-containing protein [Gallaecimonas kandeliae]WKE66814.1 ankyrin repeat domain-containing protein [Gallaecimonas kandeliae]